MDVIKITNTAERDKIEAWTKANTFPHVIAFVEDAKGGWVVGTEVLSDPAYQKLSFENPTTREKEPLRDYLVSKSTTVVYEPKPESDGTKTTTTGTK